MRRCLKVKQCILDLLHLLHLGQSHPSPNQKGAINIQVSIPGISNVKMFKKRGKNHQQILYSAEPMYLEELHQLPNKCSKSNNRATKTYSKQMKQPIAGATTLSLPETTTTKEAAVQTCSCRINRTPITAVVANRIPQCLLLHPVMQDHLCFQVAILVKMLQRLQIMREGTTGPKFSVFHDFLSLWNLLMSSNYQRLSDQKHYLQHENTYKSYKRQKEMTRQVLEDRRQQCQFTCGNKLSTYSDDEMTFQRKESEPLIVSMDNFEQEMNQPESIAMCLIDENIRLKSQLEASKQQTQRIKLEFQNLNTKYLQLKNNNQVNFYKKKIKQLKQELMLTLHQNTQITEEILKLKEVVSQYKENVAQQKNSRISFGGHNKENRCRSNSVQVYHRESHKVSDEGEMEQRRKLKELLDSIKFMYTKITGYKIQSLKELWRWLKDIGHFYSRFRKWKTKARNCIQHLYYSPIDYQQLICLIEQGVEMVQ